MNNNIITQSVGTDGKLHVEVSKCVPENETIDTNHFIDSNDDFYPYQLNEWFIKQAQLQIIQHAN